MQPKTRKEPKPVTPRKGWTDGYTRIGKLRLPNLALTQLTPLNVKQLLLIESYSYGEKTWWASDLDVAALSDAGKNSVNLLRKKFEKVGVPLDFTTGLGRGNATVYTRKSPDQQGPLADKSPDSQGPLADKSPDQRRGKVPTHRDPIKKQVQKPKPSENPKGSEDEDSSSSRPGPELSATEVADCERTWRSLTTDEVVRHNRLDEQDLRWLTGQGVLRKARGRRVGVWSRKEAQRLESVAAHLARKPKSDAKEFHIGGMEDPESESRRSYDEYTKKRIAQVELETGSREATPKEEAYFREHPDEDPREDVSGPKTNGKAAPTIAHAAVPGAKGEAAACACGRRYSNERGLHAHLMYEKSFVPIAEAQALARSGGYTLERYCDPAFEGT